MTTYTKIDNRKKVIPIYDKTLKLTMDKRWYSLRSIYCTCMYICMCKPVDNYGCPLTELAAHRPAVAIFSTQTDDFRYWILSFLYQDITFYSIHPCFVAYIASLFWSWVVLIITFCLTWQSLSCTSCAFYLFSF